MKKKQSYRFFRFFASSVLFVFMGILAGATFIAYSRISGSTGLSMFKVQQMRAEAIAERDGPVYPSTGK